jgi:uncharacterized protein (TIGR02145 family)
MTLKSLFRILPFLLVVTSLTAQTEADTIPSVKIGKQTWSQMNLNTSKFRNGDEILEVKTNADWEKASREKKAAWCYYDFNAKNGETYGKLYNWFAVSDPRGIAPKGWHIAINDEWNLLKDGLTSSEGEAGKFLKNIKGWKGGDKATNASGFSAFPSGITYWQGAFAFEKTHAYFWTASPLTPKKEPWHFILYGKTHGLQQSRDLDLGCGMAVRCVKD